MDKQTRGHFRAFFPTFSTRIVSRKTHTYFSFFTRRQHLTTRTMTQSYCYDTSATTKPFHNEFGLFTKCNSCFMAHIYEFIRYMMFIDIFAIYMVDNEYKYSDRFMYASKSVKCVGREHRRNFGVHHLNQSAF